MQTYLYDCKLVLFHLYLILDLSNEWGQYYSSHLTDQETEPQQVQTIPGWGDDQVDNAFVTHKPAGQSLDPESPCESWAGEAAVCNASTREAGTGHPSDTGWDHPDLSSVRAPASVLEAEGNLRRHLNPSVPLNEPVHIHVPQTCKHEYTHAHIQQTYIPRRKNEILEDISTNIGANIPNRWTSRFATNC